MVRRLSLIGLWFGLTSLSALTVAGVTAPWLLGTELVNDFRPFLLAASFLAIAWVGLVHASLPSRVTAVACLALNITLSIAPMIWAAPSTDRSDLKVLTFNVWVGNRTAAAVAQYIRSTGADIVVLEEVDARLEKEIVPALSTDYPNVVSCAQRNCGLVLLSRSSWTSSGSSDRRPGAPPMVWAEFPSYTVTGVHLAFPFQPIWQDAQTAFLAHRFAGAAKSQIVVGDFNLTPFSWKLNRLSHQSGLLRHATIGASWPANRLKPVVLLDNLLASPGIASAGVNIGPSGLGSDHRPLIFDLSIDAQSKALTPPS